MDQSRDTSLTCSSVVLLTIWTRIWWNTWFSGEDHYHDDLLALETSKNWKWWQMDVKNSLLHRKLDPEIYMNKPKGFENEIRVMSLYIQSPKKPHLNAAQRILKYVNDTIDYCLLYKGSKDYKSVGYCDVDYAKATILEDQPLGMCWSFV